MIVVRDDSSDGVIVVRGENSDSDTSESMIVVMV